jgi:hypothetical protein
MGKGPGPGMQQGTTDPMHGSKSKDAPVTAALGQSGRRMKNVPPEPDALRHHLESAHHLDLWKAFGVDNRTDKGIETYQKRASDPAVLEKLHIDRHATQSGHWHSASRLGHGFAQTDTVKHCPFCGSGDVWGGSDGTITCEFDGATFQVSVEPEYPSAPGNMDGMPLNIDGEPDPMGQADSEDAMAVPEGMSPSSGEELGMGDDEGGDDEGGEGGGPPWLDQGDDEDEDDDDEDEEDQGPPGNLPPRKSSYRTYMGDDLSEDQYLKHLAIRHAEEPRLFLASLRSGH